MIRAKALAWQAELTRLQMEMIRLQTMVTVFLDQRRNVEPLLQDMMTACRKAEQIMQQLDNYATQEAQAGYAP